MTQVGTDFMCPLNGCNFKHKESEEVAKHIQWDKMVEVDHNGEKTIIRKSIYRTCKDCRVRIIAAHMRRHTASTKHIHNETAARYQRERCVKACIIQLNKLYQTNVIQRHMPLVSPVELSATTLYCERAKESPLSLSTIGLRCIDSMYILYQVTCSRIKRSRSFNFYIFLDTLYVYRKQMSENKHGIEVKEITVDRDKLILGDDQKGSITIEYYITNTTAASVNLLSPSLYQERPTFKLSFAQNHASNSIAPGGLFISIFPFNLVIVIWAIWKASIDVGAQFFIAHKI